MPGNTTTIFDIVTPLKGNYSAPPSNSSKGTHFFLQIENEKDIIIRISATVERIPNTDPDAFMEL